MIRMRMPSVLLATLLSASPLLAAENETIFLPQQGKLVIPHLVLGDDIYFVVLNRTNPNTYNFNLDAASVTKVTPQAGDDWASRDEIIGDWAATELPGVTLGIFASGSYSIIVPAEDGCTAGAEAGTWTYDEDTGVFFARAVSDTNGDCGLSHPDGAIRLERVGANLRATIVESDNGTQQVMQLTLTPD